MKKIVIKRSLALLLGIFMIFGSVLMETGLTAGASETGQETAREDDKTAAEDEQDIPDQTADEEEDQKDIKQEETNTQEKQEEDKTEVKNENKNDDKIPALPEAEPKLPKTALLSVGAVEEPLMRIPTISTPDIDLRIYDYNPNDWSQQVLGGGFNNGAVQGFVKNWLEDGLPQKKKGNAAPITSLFGDAAHNNKKKNIKADNLFYKDSEGYYYYNSAENYAYLNQSTGKFEVYNWVAVPTNLTPSSYNIGNFFPFNPLASNSPVMKTASDGRKLHNLQKGTGAKTVNNGFGMSFSFNFMQPKNGAIGDKDMIFEFGGDDDVFVFVDNKLVLDIGGSHNYVSGSIDFATGAVKVSPVTTASAGYGASTTLKKIFGLEGKTFDNWSTHNLKFFFTDRGGASNCKIKFNIPTMPQKTLMVTKELSNTDKEKYTDVEFDFNLHLKESGSSSYRKVTASDSKYNHFDIYKDGKDTGRQGSVDADGVFKLKPGETARFSDVPADTWYYVEETGINSQEYDEVKVNGTEVAGYDEEENKTNHEFSAKSEEALAGDQVSVVFTNNCSAYNKRELTVKKVMAEGQSSDEEFIFNVKLGGLPYTGEYYKNGNSSPESEPMKNGKITLKQNEYITLCEIPSGTSFEVTEDTKALNEDYELFDDPAYVIDHADNKKTNGAASGSIVLGKNTTVTVTNRMILGNLTVNKTYDDANFHNGDPIFTFKIERIGKDGKVQETIYRTIRFTESMGKNASFTIADIPIGKYRVTELETMRYKVQGDNPVNVTLTKAEKNGTAEFYNKRVYKKNLSHTDTVSNEFSIGEDGSVTVKQNTSPDGTPGAQ